MARGLVQFGAGMAAAPIRGAGYVNTMLRGASLMHCLTQKKVTFLRF